MTTMPTPYPTPGAWTGVSDMLDYANTVTDGMLGLGLLILFFIFAFMAFYQVTNVKRFAAASFLTMILAWLFLIANLTSFAVVGFFIGLTILGFIGLALSNDG